MAIRLLYQVFLEDIVLINSNGFVLTNDYSTLLLYDAISNDPVFYKFR